jgi:hypothetical protein
MSNEKQSKPVTSKRKPPIINRKHLGFIVIATLGIGFSVFIGLQYGWWQGGFAALSIAIIVTIIPIV